MTTSPFKQRPLIRRGEKLAGVRSLVRASVPQLSGASARALARVVAEDEAVAALRKATRESLHVMLSLPPTGQREKAAELCRRLQTKADALSKKMADDRRWKRNIPGVLAVAGGIAATAAAIGPAGSATAIMDLLRVLALFGTGTAIAGR